MQATVNTPLRNKSKPIMLGVGPERERKCIKDKGDPSFAKDEAHIRAPTAAEAIQASPTRLPSPAPLEMFVHRFSSREITVQNFDSRVM